jgi:hypothetical protein
MPSACVSPNLGLNQTVPRYRTALPVRPNPLCGKGSGDS